MRKNLIKITLGTIGMVLLFSSNAIIAQVYDQFQSVETRNIASGPAALGLDFKLPQALQDDFVVFTDGVSTGPATYNSFRLFPSPATRPDNNLDDGYAIISDIGFSYRFNDKDYDRIYVSINGFITFEEPPGNEIITRDPNCLFINDVGGAIPTNVIAPYWGDHKYWTNTLSARDSGKVGSQIGYVKFKYETVDPVTFDIVEKNAILIQWLNLNINWCDRIKDPAGVVTDSVVYLGNVASFQLIIYEGPNPDKAQQGDVEFRYGPYQMTQEQLESPNRDNIFTNPNNKAAVGVKGSSQMGYNKADFINAIYCGNIYYPEQYPADVFKQQNYETLMTLWPPSGHGSRGILLVADHSIIGNEVWGDGDADMSSGEGGRHRNQPQNRFVTLSDVREIMAATVTGKKLDSLYKKSAYHADVHHDGRYYFLQNRNSGIFRYDRTSGGNIVLDNSLYDTTSPTYDPIYAPGAISRDTFYIRKVGALEGKFGFLEHWGKNDDFIYIDFIDFGIPVSQSVRKFKIIDKGNTAGDPDFEYQMRIAIVSDGINPYTNSDRTVMWNASENNINNRIEVLRIKLKKHIVWRDMLLTQRISDLPGISNPYTEIFYEANELDASFIMAWLGGQISELPWIYENIEHNKKKETDGIPYKNATNIAFNNEKVDGDNVVLPIYYNGVADNNQSVKFNFNAEVVNIESANSNVMVEFSNNTKTAVIISNGYFNPNNPIAYVTLSNDVNSFDATNVRFYGEDADNVSYKLANGSSIFDNNSLSNNPNPATTYTDITVNIPVTGNYKLVIYDNSGNLVKEFECSDLGVGPYQFHWDCSKVVSGTYFYTLEGANTSVTKSLIIAR
ncbi:MAG: T9SS type A sorting domain-containing protein [Bacteroidetes bacterium]|nr:T9SS type A sorting domain-containing protein [Bacteroidota bacterium]